jgi:Bax protein
MKTFDAAQPQKSAPRKVVPNSKREFLEKIAPLVHSINEEVTLEREYLVNIIDQMNKGYELNSEQSVWLKSRMKKYRVKSEVNVTNLRESLLPKIDVIPVELALAQAANESAWGKSRFAREAQNLFGVWTYDESKGIVPKRRAKGAKHLVRKYESMEASIRHYITLLNSHPAYKVLRDIRLALRTKGEQLDGVAMAAGLIKYSAKGEKYVAIIRSMINSNNLTDFRTV